MLGAWADMPNAKVALGAEAIAALQGNAQANVLNPLPEKEAPAAPENKQEEPTASKPKKEEPLSASGTVFLENISLTMRGADELEVDWAGSEVADLRDDSVFAVYYGEH